MVYTPRLVIPEDGNAYYNTKKNGGYSNAIVGKPVCDGLNVLSNCVGYAHGRFHEICGDTTMSQLCPVNAEMFIDYKSKDLKVGTTPKLGAVVVWQKGATKSGADGCGHVAIVEQINADGSIVTSESGYGNTVPFTTKTRKNDGNWGQPSTYKFLGFIYQKIDYDPAPSPTPTPTPSGTPITFSVNSVSRGSRGDDVLRVQIILKGLGYYTGSLDKSAGNLTHNAILRYQKERGLAVDGYFGPQCWKSFLGV